MHKINEAVSDGVLTPPESRRVIQGLTMSLPPPQEAGVLDLARHRIEALLELIAQERPLQKKYLNKLMQVLSASDQAALANVIAFYETEGFSLEFQAKAYLVFLDDTLEETKYFVEHGKYRYAKLTEVADKVYFDAAYMTQYMVGLALSLYLWEQHRETLHWFMEKMRGCTFDNYLEIGPGHGEYFLKAIEQGRFKNYCVVDISQTSLALTQRYIETAAVKRPKDIAYVCEDFLRAAVEKSYDVIVMGEVLEHVEEPETLLRKLKLAFSGQGFCFISVPINAPAKDHIYLFRSQEEVITMVKHCGFEIMEYRCFCANGRTIEKAVKNKEAILMALLLK